MRTVLILSKAPALASAIEGVLDRAKYQVIIKEDLWAAEPLLSRGAIDALILEMELTDARGIQMIEQVRQAAPKAPLIVVSSAKQWEWEEDAYLLGVFHIVSKPIRAKLLNNLLERAFHEQDQRGPDAPAGAAAGRQAAHEPDHFRALVALRRFSGILTHSLDPEALLKEFLLLLREIVGVNRAVIFLRKPLGTSSSETAPGQEDRWLRSACAIGLEQSFLEHFALSLGNGIGAFLRRQGRILKSTSQEAQASREITKEFQLLGAHVAIPILDRETLLGVAVLDERLTGESYANEELSLIFHMLEEVGLAIRNSWLHDQLTANHAMVADILGHLESGCLVIGGNLAILHMNAAARRMIMNEREGKTQAEFSDLPQELGSKVFTVIKTGMAAAPFKYQFATTPEASFQVSISPFRTQGASDANAALLIIEDITQMERAKRLDVETSNLRLITAMAEHLAHEIGNSVVPLSTHQQLLDSGVDDEEFRTSLSAALGDGVKRITRLANQMMFLARGKTDFGDQIPMNELIGEAFRDAYVYQTGKPPGFEVSKEVEMLTVAGDHKALRHAFAEVLLNALQANPKTPDEVAVQVKRGPGASAQAVNIEIRDKGEGFTPEAARRGSEPFFSTRNVGLGLGLTVTRKIIEDHRGTVEISPGGAQGQGIVRITLPLSEQN